MAQKLERSEIVTLAGTRPEVIKLSEFVKYFRNLKHTYVYTGQHFSTNMRDIFFDELDSNADVDLQCNTSDVLTMSSKIALLLGEIKPSLLVVYGDTNSTLAGALAAKKTEIPVVHIEAGLRSFDLRMPEERNRIKIDQISNHLLCPTTLSREFLAFEGITDNIYVTGNLIVDVCRKFSKIIVPRKNDLPDDYILLTLHRAENVDNIESLKRLCAMISLTEYMVVFPIHPRTKKNLIDFNIKLPRNIIPIDPVGYMDFLQLLKGSKIVLTDSGGVQEEAVVLGKPCITLRHTTERWETVLMGANRLYPLMLQSDTADFRGAIHEMLGKRITHQPYGESVTEVTVQKIMEILSKNDN